MLRTTFSSLVLVAAIFVAAPAFAQEKEPAPSWFEQFKSKLTKENFQNFLSKGALELGGILRDAGTYLDSASEKLKPKTEADAQERASGDKIEI